MSQLGTTNLPTPRASGYLGLTASLVVCAIGLSGCQLAENIDVAKCMIPPNEPHEFAAPTNYGYFPTMWRPWPGAESGPETAPNRDKSREEVTGTPGPETLPEPNAEGDAKEALEPGMDVFDLPAAPEGGAIPDAGEGTEKPADDTAPDTTLPDELMPPTSPPETGPEELPGALIPDDGPLAPPEATPEKGAWNLESLPTDAPQGSLIPDAPESVVEKAPTPELLVPEDEMARTRGGGQKRVKNALRPSPTRGASATEAAPGNTFRTFSRDIKLADKKPDGIGEGPELVVPAQITDTPKRKPAAAESAAVSQPSPGGSAPGWRANAASPQAKKRSLANSTSSSGEGWQRRPSRTPYPAQQTTHIEPQPQPSDRPVESTSSEAGNPLR